MSTENKRCIDCNSRFSCRTDEQWRLRCGKCYQQFKEQDIQNKIKIRCYSSTCKGKKFHCPKDFRVNRVGQRDEYKNVCGPCHYNNKSGQKEYFQECQEREEERQDRARQERRQQERSRDREEEREKDRRRREQEEIERQEEAHRQEVQRQLLEEQRLRLEKQINEMKSETKRALRELNDYIDQMLIDYISSGDLDDEFDIRESVKNGNYCKELINLIDLKLNDEEHTWIRDLHHANWSKVDENLWQLRNIMTWTVYQIQEKQKNYNQIVQIINDSQYSQKQKLNEVQKLKFSQQKKDFIISVTDNMVQYCFYDIKPPMKRRIYEELKKKYTHSKDIVRVFSRILEKLRDDQQYVEVEFDKNTDQFKEKEKQVQLLADNHYQNSQFATFFSLLDAWSNEWSVSLRVKIMVMYYLLKKPEILKELGIKEESEECRNRRDMVIQMMEQFKNQGKIQMVKREQHRYQHGEYIPSEWKSMEDDHLVFNSNLSQACLIELPDQENGASVLLLKMPEDLKNVQDNIKSQQQKAQDWLKRVFAFARENISLISQQDKLTNSDEKKYFSAGEHGSFPTVTIMEQIIKTNKKVSKRTTDEKKAINNFWCLFYRQQNEQGSESDTEEHINQYTQTQLQRDWKNLLYQEKISISKFIGFYEKMVHRRQTFLIDLFFHLGVDRETVVSVAKNVRTLICTQQNRSEEDFLKKDFEKMTP